MALQKHKSTSFSGFIIEKEPCYHGFLPREDVKTLLKTTGDFLVRITEPKKGEPRSFVISVMHNVPPNPDEDAWIKHFVIKVSENRFYIEKTSFASVQELVEYHLKTRESIKDDVRLVQPILRQPWELDHDNIEILKKLGEGAFGEVSMGKLKFRKINRSLPVAVKQAKLSNLTKDQIKEFMGEARIMRGLGHPHVVRFYGVAAACEPLYMVMELASNGALDSYLQKNKDMLMEKRNEMILQAAWGLEYLHAKPIVHRDIAARNCLYGEGRVKISDFGLSRHGSMYQADAKKKVPIRWLSTEVVRLYQFSLKSDVWAYAIMAWEIWNNGQEPYPGMSVPEVATKVAQGYRMELPETLQPEAKELFTKSWSGNEDERPSMEQIARDLQQIFGIPRPDFTEMERRIVKELETLNTSHLTNKNKVISRKRAKKALLPKGL